MDILLIASNTIFNGIVRNKTNSQWGHSSVVIDDVVYDFDYNNKSKFPLSSILSDSSIYRATLFHTDILVERDAEELYKELFDTCNYDIKSLFRLRDKINSGRDLDNIQSYSDSYTCSSIIAKSFYKQIIPTPEFLRDVHWSQVIPSDYSNLEFKEDFIGDWIHNKK